MCCYEWDHGRADVVHCDGAGSDVVAGHAAHGASQGSGALLQRLDTRQTMEIDRPSSPAMHDAGSVAPAIVIPPLTCWGDETRTRQQRS